MVYTKIKICGITRLEDARHCESCGVDAIGFVFVAKSKRNLTLDAAADISSQLGPFTTRTGLFLNADTIEVEAALERIPGLLPQFHGQESAAWCDGFNRPYIKAIGTGSGMPDPAALAQYTQASSFLFDSNAAGELGGTGHTFDWSAIDWSALRESLGKPLVLAGGLSHVNLQEAIETVRPYAVDASSSVESAPGLKDHDLISRFTAKVTQINTRSCEGAER
ncbi:MAG: phosphoribosylanthranilate isomerase [Gammaproteobacteria bacterium]|nr:phosphoribosylanthranilate isomerase [Gammaproteobacteria bacterium]